MRYPTCVAILALLVGLAALPLRGNARSSTTQLGFVDLNRLFESAPARAQLEGELGAHRSQLEEVLRTIDGQLAELATELNLLEKGTQRHEELELRVLTLQQKRALEQRRLTEEFARKKAAFHDRILEGIEREIEAYAREHGYSAILQREFTLSQESRSWKAALYVEPTSDVTDAILTRLRAGQ